MLTDSHCHLHDPEFFPEGGQAEYERAVQSGVHRLICIGTDARSSARALDFAKSHKNVFATIGIHPHDASLGRSELKKIAELPITSELVAVGEIGLDYYYDNSPRSTQRDMFEKQLDLARQRNLPVVFHVRDTKEANGQVFDDFWPIVDNFSGIAGVLHSFTDNMVNLEKGLERGLYVGVNGIATFVKDRDEITLAIPDDRILLETDAPFLTPKPLRGKINEPGNVGLIASYVAELRGISIDDLAHKTEQNVNRLFFSDKK